MNPLHFPLNVGFRRLASALGFATTTLCACTTEVFVGTLDAGAGLQLGGSEYTEADATAKGGGGGSMSGAGGRIGVGGDMGRGGDGAGGALPADSGIDTGTTTSTQCVLPTYAPSVLCETFCHPERLDVVIDEPPSAAGLRCVGGGGSGSCNGNDVYQAFDYADQRIDLYLSFDPSIAGNYTPERFAATFSYLWMYVYVPDPKNLAYYIYVDAIRAGDPRILDLHYDGERLSGRIDLGEITLISRNVESMESTCRSDDIAGRCSCGYAVSPMPVTVEFHLPVQSSG